MEPGPLEVYRIVVEDTNQMLARRQGLDSIYVTIVTLVLAGDGYVAAGSQFDNWLPVVATLGIGIVGYVVTGRWRQGVADLNENLQFRFQWLRDLEAKPPLAGIGASLFTQEYQHVIAPREKSGKFRRRGFLARSHRLQALFRTVFVLVPLLLAGLTLASSDPTLHPLIHPLIQPH